MSAELATFSFEGDAHVLGGYRVEVADVDAPGQQSGLGMLRHELVHEIRPDRKLFAAEIEEVGKVLAALHLGVWLSEFIEELCANVERNCISPLLGTEKHYSPRW